MYITHVYNIPHATSLTALTQLDESTGTSIFLTFISLLPEFIQKAEMFWKLQEGLRSLNKTLNLFNYIYPLDNLD